MSDFDLGPYLTPGATPDGQLYHSEGIQPNMFYACTFEALRESGRDYGYGEPYDDEQLRQMSDPGSHYGENWGMSIIAARVAYPGLADIMSWEFPTDLIATLREYGSRGYMVHAGFWCDQGANVPPIGPITYSHAERIMAADSNGVFRLENVEPHPTYLIQDSDLLNLYDHGGILVFKKSLIPAAQLPDPTPTPEELNDMVGTYLFLEPAGARQADVLADGSVIEVPLDVVSIACSPNAQYNLTSFTGSEVDVYGSEVDGTPRNVSHTVEPGNQPDVAAPKQVFGLASDLGITGIGDVLTFINRKAGRVCIWIH